MILIGQISMARQDEKGSEKTNDNHDQVCHLIVLSSILVRFPLLRQDTEDKQLVKILAHGFSPWLLCPVAIYVKDRTP